MKNIAKQLFAFALLLTATFAFAQSPRAEYTNLTKSTGELTIGGKKSAIKFSTKVLNYFDLTDKKEAFKGSFTLDLDKGAKIMGNNAVVTVNNMKFEKGTNGAYKADVTLKMNGVTKTYKNEMVTFNMKDKSGTLILSITKKDFAISADGTLSLHMKF